jgi:photoactive yellow protein
MPIFSQELLGMSEAELDALPFGIIRLDKNGRVLHCNKAQASFSRRAPGTSVGRDFFREVAPCAAVQNFQGRFLDFVAGSGSAIESFTFAFRFTWGSRWVMITFVRAASIEQGVYIVVALAVLDPLAAKDAPASIRAGTGVGARLA